MEIKHIRPLVLLTGLLIAVAAGFAGEGEEAPLVRTDAETGRADNYDIKWQVISSGGTDGASASFKLSGTVSQTAVGIGSSESFTVSHGFWQESAQRCDCIPGDANASGAYDIDDVVYLIAYIFSGGPAPIPYAICSGDPNCSCGVDIDDVVYLIAYIFSGGPPPCTCEDWVAACGWPLRD
jgi:hypothetical protein